ncbi:MAG: DUF4317 domain-containing protein [Lachnospiraceae bacterium]|nr:DUF4317 domain-containing protein [Lachnospiraceae bacterium]
MNKKEVLEIKRRLTKDGCTFTRMCGCYVNSSKEMVVKINQNFLNLEEEEFYKYLEISKKVLSGTVGNNILTLPFPTDEEQPGGRQQFLLGLRQSELKNDDLLDRFYELIIENFDYVGNYLILLFHDNYDVMTKTSDNNKLDESEEVFEYLLCAICPVTLSKPGLGYREDENTIGLRVRDWVVGLPENGFVFPAFNDRSTDIHSIMYYCKNPKDPNAAFMEAGLGCESQRTATEKKNAFTDIVRSSFSDEEKADVALTDLTQAIKDYVDENTDETDSEAAPVVLDTQTFKALMSESGFEESVSEKIEKKLEEEFTDNPPEGEYLVDSKILAIGEQKRRERELREEVAELKQEVEEKTIALEDATLTSKTYDVIVRVKPEKVVEIKSDTIDGRKCLIIPMDEDEFLNVNGKNTTF